jgi:CHAT domain-containing protein/tetratricopeptide (TPR) repeat protein
MTQRTLLSVLVVVFCCALIAGEGAPARSQATEVASRLELGTPIDREISGRQQHAYEVALKAGEYAEVIVEQRGIDVVVTVRDSAGKLVAEFDAESGKEGSEFAGLAAQSASEYRVSVRPRYSRATPGHYEIRLGEIRAATGRDRDLFDAHRLSTEATVLNGAGKYDEALTLAARAVDLGEETLRPNEAYLAELLTKLADVHRAKGNTSAAEQLFVRAVAIDRATLGTSRLQTANHIGRLAALYNAAGDFVKSAPLLDEALAITERSVGAVHPQMVQRLMDLSLLHSRREDYDRAVPELQRALTIADATLESGDILRIAILNNLGDVYSLLEDYDHAEPLLTQALEGAEKALGPDHHRLAVPLQNLAIVARNKKEYARALDFLWRAEAIRERALGPRHTETAMLLLNIGNVYSDQSDYARARENFVRALDVLETSAGPYHRLTMLSLSNLARVYTAEGDIARALEYEARVDGLLEREIQFNLAIGSEREKLAYFTSTMERTSRTLSLHAQHAPNDAAAAELAATAAVQRKGRVLDAMAGSLLALREHLEADGRGALDRLRTTTSELAALALNGPGRTPFAEYRARLTSLEQQRERLESEVSARSAEFRAQSRPVTLSTVREAIPDGAALVEFVVFQPFDAKAPVDSTSAFGPGRYIAYVVQRRGAVHWKELGSTEEIDAAVAALRGALRDPKRGDVKQRAREIDRRVMQPVRAMVGDATQLLVSPDGELNLIPFEALVDEDEHYLVERYAISYLTTGRDLLRLQVPRASQSEPLIVADPFFGEPPIAATPAGGTSVKHASTKTARRSITTARDLSHVYFAPLSGTGDEARIIKSLFPAARVLTGTHATKGELEHVNAPSILHVATHGFFLQEDARVAPPAGSARAPASRAAGETVAIQNPLLRSGLALSGANLDSRATGGILTALEAANLNLWGTKLVTLSACDTGIGEVRSGEGVYGLRRAFVLAGAETLVMSLWPVSDYVTREMMTGYYRGLQTGLGRGDALRQTQLAMLARPNRRHPFYWAGFIQAGEWANLDGRR